MPTLEQELAKYANARVGGETPEDRLLRQTRPPRKPGCARSRFRLMSRFWQHPDTPKLPHVAQAAWGYLWLLADARGTCFPSIRRIGDHLGCSKRHAQTAIATLRGCGFLSVVAAGCNRGKNRANTYRIRLPSVQGGDEAECAYQGNQNAP